MAFFLVPHVIQIIAVVWTSSNIIDTDLSFTCLRLIRNNVHASEISKDVGKRRFITTSAQLMAVSLRPKIVLSIPPLPYSPYTQILP